MTITEMIAVLEAAKAGKRIEYHRIGMKGWSECPLETIAWNFANWEYRVKPEPREWWIAGVFPAKHASWIAYEHEREACEATRGYPVTFVVHVREVLDEGGAQ